MVLSTSAKARSAASLANQNTGGGVKKAGIPRSISAAMRVAFEERGLPQPMSVMMLPLVSTVRVNRGIGWRFLER
jgi:hypothetical protein